MAPIGDGDEICDGKPPSREERSAATRTQEVCDDVYRCRIVRGRRTSDAPSSRRPSSHARHRRNVPGEGSAGLSSTRASRRSGRSARSLSPFRGPPERPSRIDFLPSSRSSGGNASSWVRVMNSDTSRVRPSPRLESRSGVKCGISEPFADIKTSPGCDGPGRARGLPVPEYFLTRARRKRVRLGASKIQPSRDRRGSWLERATSRPCLPAPVP